MFRVYGRVYGLVHEELTQEEDPTGMCARANRDGGRWWVGGFEVALACSQWLRGHVLERGWT